MARINLPADRKAAERLLAEPQGPHVYLAMFWAKAETASQGKRLELLKAMGAIAPLRSWENPARRRQEMRKHFTFKLLDFDPEDRCFLCAGPWHHRHHILNIQHGGGNSRNNVVPLCRKCHAQVHSRLL